MYIAGAQDIYGAQLMEEVPGFTPNELLNLHTEASRLENAAGTGVT